MRYRLGHIFWLALAAAFFAPALAQAQGVRHEVPPPADAPVARSVDGCVATRRVLGATLTSLTLPVCYAAALPSPRPQSLTGEMYLSQGGRWINFEQEYDNFLGVRRRRHFGRAITEELAELTLGGVWYMAQKDFNKPDWFFKATFGGAVQKFTTFDLVRFDNNTFVFNQMWHPLAGMGYYMFARTNNFGPGTSFLFAVTGSTVWEYILELPEQVSINDQIVTSVGGTAIGEVVYNLGEYFNSPYSADELDQRILTAPFGSLRWIHNYLDRRNPSAPPVLRPHRRVYWPTFRLYAGAFHRGDSAAVSTPVLASVGLTTELAAMPGYQRPGQFDRYFDVGNFTRLDLDTSFGEHGYDAFSLYAQAMMFGYYKQDISEEAHRRRGYSLALGEATSYQFQDYADADVGDQYAMAHLAGPALDFTMFSGPLRARLQVAGFADFATLHSLAFPQYAARYDTSGIRTDLTHKGYYFAYGATIRPRLTLYWGRLGLGAELQWGRYWGFNGRDRNQEQVTHEIDLEDSLARLDAWADIPTPLDWLDLRLTYMARTRQSTADQFDTTQSFQELGARVQYRF